MKKLAIIAIAVLTLGGIGVGAFMYFNGSSNNGSPAGSVLPGASEVNFVAIDACDVLTEDIAKEIIGSNIQKTSTDTNDITTADIAITNCNYTTKINPNDTSSTPKVSGASLLIYVAKTPIGAQSNKSQFTSKDTDVQTLENIGDDAFYNPLFRQLHVLKGNNWYIITAYKDSIVNASIESNKKIAEKLNFQ